jgi:type I restriction enzyme S subunit
MTSIDLPEGWLLTTLEEVVSVEYGKGLPAKLRLDGEIPVYASAGQVGWHNEPLVEGPGVVIGRKGAAGAVTTFDGPAWVIDTAYYAVPSPHLDTRFLAYQLEAANLRSLDQSTAIPSLSRDALRRTPIAIAPMSAQTEIVDQIDRLQALIDEAVADCTSARNAVATFEAAARGVATAPTQEQVVRLEEVATIQSGITKAPPKTDDTTSIAYLRTANVQGGHLDLAEIKDISATQEQIARHSLKAGDVLVVEGGDADKVGRGWIWMGEIEPCLHQNHVFAVRPDTDLLEPMFLAHLINAPSARVYFANSAKQTTNLASINKTQLRALPIPRLSVTEQRARVDRLEVALSQAAEARSTIAEVERLSKALRTSILRAAFSGRLSRTPVAIEESQDVLALLRGGAVPAKKRRATSAVS